MSGFFDSQDFEFTCPRCKRSVNTRVSNVKRPGYKCRHCSTKYETSDFKSGIDKAEREIEQFKHRLGNLKINIKV